MHTTVPLIATLIGTLTLAIACEAPPQDAPPLVSTLRTQALNATITQATLQPLQEGVPGSPGHLIANPRNPNGDTEMAALMRDMQAHAKHARDALVHDRPLGQMPSDQLRLFSSWPSDPSVRSPLFEDLARGYLLNLHTLHQSTSPHDARRRYDALLDGCVSCHQQWCQGPLEAIEALRLPPQP